MDWIKELASLWMVSSMMVVLQLQKTTESSKKTAQAIKSGDIPLDTTQKEILEQGDV